MRRVRRESASRRTGIVALRALPLGFLLLFDLPKKGVERRPQETLQGLGRGAGEDQREPEAGEAAAVRGRPRALRRGPLFKGAPEKRPPSS
mmetsp:Transcript_3662/g.11612  ORF Transcript_3662/g.11612 Transcript_3662/m.11612 type:complete len:91 (+) Transcript_3662:494-766(+)